MECMVEGALKRSFRKEMKYNSTSPQAQMEEVFSAFNVVQNGAPSDDFFVDQLLDFSHVDQQQEQEQEQEQEQQEQHNQPGDSTACDSLVEHPFPPLPTTTTDLNLPDDVADLEWLSHFVEDSFSQFSPPIVPEAPPTNTAKPSTSTPPAPPHPCFNTPVPAKARSKRTRTGVRVWPLVSPSFATTDSSSTTTTSSTSSSPSSPLLIYATNLSQAMDQVSSNAPPKKPKKKPSPEAGFPAQAPRRCTHCGVQKTPQWRTGPLGAKTLCNACGVRFKSGRLLPEYRPACSPTFSSELHSNHHRKVLEMRRKKETISGGVDTAGLAPSPVVPSF